METSFKMSIVFFQEKFPNNTGPIYQETIQGRLPVEPFNTFSNLIFIAILIFFILRIYKNPKQHIFLWDSIAHYFYKLGRRYHLPCNT